MSCCWEPSTHLSGSGGDKIGKIPVFVELTLELWKQSQCIGVRMKRWYRDNWNKKITLSSDQSRAALDTEREAWTKVEYWLIRGNSRYKGPETKQFGTIMEESKDQSVWMEQREGGGQEVAKGWALGNLVALILGFTWKRKTLVEVLKQNNP